MAEQTRPELAERKSLTECCGNLLFLNIFKTFRIAIQTPRLLTAFLAVAVIFITGWLMDFNKTVIVSGKLTSSQLRSSALASTADWPTELHCFVREPQRMNGFIQRYKNGTEKQGVFRVWSNFCLAKFNDAAVSIVLLNFSDFVAYLMACVAACIWALKYHTFYSIVFIVIALTAFSISGGAICRGAALQFSRNEKPGITQCLQFALKKFISLFSAPLAPIILMAIFAIGIMLLGLITNIPWVGELILVLFLIIVLLAGTAIALAVFATAAGTGLVFGAIAYESADAFDSINRSWRYVYYRPWRLGFYTLLAAVYGSICYLFVNFFAFLMLSASRTFLSVIIWTKGSKAALTGKLDVLWPKPEFFNLLGGGLEISKNVTEYIAASVIHLAVLVVAGLVIAFAVSFYFSAGTIIYCLLRNKTDNTAVDDIFIEAAQIQQETETGQTQSFKQQQ